MLPIEINVRDVEGLRSAGSDFLLLDCREPEEQRIATIEGSRLISMGELPERLGELSGREQGRVIVYCHLGGRSLRVAMWLRQQGFAEAQSMAGGIDEWAVEIELGMPRY